MTDLEETSELDRQALLESSAIMVSGFALNDAVRTGFAIFMRNVAIRELEIPLGAINGISYEKYMQNNREMWDRYRQDSTADFQSVFMQKRPETEASYPPPNLWAAMWWDVYAKSGYDINWLKRFLEDLKKRNNPASTVDIFCNLQNAICETMKENFCERTLTAWKWDISEKSAE